MNNISIFLVPEPASNGLVALKLHANGLPDNFLGLAFHISFSRNDWAYEGFQLEGRWKDQADKLLSLASFGTSKGGSGGEVVFGLSVRGQERPTVNTFQDEVVATFFVKSGPDALDLNFTDTTLSVVQDGKRIDVNDAVFRGVSVVHDGTKTDQPGKAPLSPGNNVAKEVEGVGEAASFSFKEGDLSSGIISNPLGYGSYDSVFQVYMVVLSFALVLVLGVGLAYGYRRWLNKKTLTCPKKQI